MGASCQQGHGFSGVAVLAAGERRDLLYNAGFDGLRAQRLENPNLENPLQVQGIIRLEHQLVELEE